MVYKSLLCVQISPLLLSFSSHSKSSKSRHFEHLLKPKIYEKEKQTGWKRDDFSSKSKRLKNVVFLKKDNFFLKVNKMDTYHELESQFWAKNSKKCAV